MSSRTSHRATAADEPLMGMPEPAEKPREPSAGELVAAWCRGWTENNGGQQPHPSVVRRVAGVCRNVARDCEQLEQWQDAWRAALSAGRAGRYDVVAHLAAPVQQTRGNHYLGLVQNPGEAATGGLLGAMLAGGGAEGPAAIGGGL